MSHKVFLASVLAVALLFPLAAAAQSAAGPAAPADSTVQAVAYSPIPPNARFETQANEDSELTQDALQLVNQQLADRGHAVGEGAPLVMVVETDLVRGHRQDDPLGQAYANNHETRIEGRLFSSSQNSLLNPNPPLGSGERTFRISLSVYDRASGLYVWRGSAQRDNPDLDVNKASIEMVRELIGYLGRTVKQVPAPRP